MVTAGLCKGIGVDVMKEAEKMGGVCVSYYTTSLWHMVIKACSYKLFLMIKDFKLKVFLPLVHLLSSLPASFFSELVEAPLIIWLMTCSRSCDFLR